MTGPAVLTDRTVVGGRGSVCGAAQGVIVACTSVGGGGVACEAGPASVGFGSLVLLVGPVALRFVSSSALLVGPVALRFVSSAAEPTSAPDVVCVPSAGPTSAPNVVCVRGSLWLPGGDPSVAAELLAEK